MRRTAALLLAFASLGAQSAPGPRSAETRLNEQRAAVIQSRLELAALRRRLDDASATTSAARTPPKNKYSTTQTSTAASAKAWMTVLAARSTKSPRL